MTARITFLMLVLATALLAQTNEVFNLKAGGKYYPKARIDRVTDFEAIVYFEGGIAKVPLKDLPPELRKKYGYDPVKAAKAEQEQAEQEKAKRLEAAKRAAQLQAAEAAKVGPLLRLPIYEASGNYGYDQCNTPAGTLLISGLPAQVKSYLNQMTTLDATIRQREQAADSNEAAIKRADALTPKVIAGDYDYVDEMVARRQQIELAKISADEERKYIQKLKESLASFQASAEPMTTVLAFSTGNSYAGLPIWKCNGMAPPQVEPPATNAPATTNTPAENGP